ncbi:MAG TPA: AAA family ATPase [Rhabdochlamydiaceae bacterium]|nr:AAA family ATPase [Rhabdochlamydiaceae bacterium]
MKRIYQELIFQHLSQLRQMVFLMGPRQVGKTTLSLESASEWPKHFYFNWDNAAEKLLYIKGPDAIARQAGLDELTEQKPVLIFDEIHKFGKWKNFLKGFFDLYEKKTKIIVTGSARLNIYKKGGDSLMGRYFYYRIHPLSVAEIASPNLIQEEIRPPAPIAESDWTALLEHGGFPEPFIQRSKAFSRRLRAIRKDQLFREDIRDGTRIQELSQLELLAELLRKQAAESMDYQSLAKKVGVSIDTIRRWLEVLNSFYYCFSIHPWSKNITRSLIKEPKLYLWDWSLVDEEGHRNENLVASHLLKATDFWNDRGFGEYGLYYLRTKDKIETDFLVTKNRKPWFLVEVKTKAKGLSPALYHFQKETEAPHAFQVAFDLPFVNKNCFEEKGPILVPAQTFLSQLV